MKFTTITMGHSGVGKTPINTLFKDKVIQAEPYRVREAPRNNKDIYYVSQEVRDTFKLLCSKDIVELFKDIEIYPLVTFFKVRDADQFLISPQVLSEDQAFKLEIYAPTLLSLLESRTAKEYLPYLVGGEQNYVLILILNSCQHSLDSKFFSVDEMKKATSHAVNCRHVLNGTKSKKAEDDVIKRVHYLQDELPAWRTLNKRSTTKFAVVDVKGWEHLEYTYFSKPVDDPKKVKKISQQKILQYQKVILKKAKKQILKSVKNEVGQNWSDRLTGCLLEDKEIDSLKAVFKD